MSCEPSASVPNFVYGTAWKEEHTPALVKLALRAGFRGIDTANQRRHYFEAGVGQGLAAAYRDGFVTRADVFCRRSSPIIPDRTIGCRMILVRSFQIR